MVVVKDHDGKIKLNQMFNATAAGAAAGTPEPLDALVGIYADPPAEPPLWFRTGAAMEFGRERPEGWGTYDARGHV